VTPQFLALLRALEACPEALEWVGAQGPQEAWRTCPRGSWLVWYAHKAGGHDRAIRQAIESCIWEVTGHPYFAADIGSQFAHDGVRDAIEYMSDPDRAHWALDRLTRVCWDWYGDAEKYDADDNGSYSGSRVRLQARFAEVIRMRIPEVP
jgi:hypothetical protein